LHETRPCCPVESFENDGGNRKLPTQKLSGNPKPRNGKLELKNSKKANSKFLVPTLSSKNKKNLEFGLKKTT